MSLFIASLNSGSNGNCYYIGNDRDAVLIDAGISCRETERRMARLNLSMDKVRAIFISHEHSDHIRGLTVLSRKYQIPVHITPRTLKNSPVVLSEELNKTFYAFEPVEIGQDLSVTAFPKLHDAADPHSFVVSGHGLKIGVFTDIGASCINVINHFKECNAVFLEANYDSKMLDEGNYPYHLKRRIRGGHGHLSNHQALQLFTAHRPDHMSHVLLSHLSRDNNDPALALELFKKDAGNTEVLVASRYNESPLLQISAGASKIISKPLATEISQTQQMSLF
jgi:phosphoribosyl 1,2-cyclic phosphodiesterase